MKEVSEANFDVLLDSSRGLVLVDFFADWCAPCKTLTPILETLDQEFPDVTFVKVNTDSNRQLAAAFAIRSLPTVAILKPKRPGPGADVLHASVGVRPPDFWRKTLRDCLAPKRSFWSATKKALGFD